MRHQSYALLAIGLIDREVLSSNLSGPILIMNEIEELKQFKEKYEKEEKRKILSNKLSYITTSFVFAAVFFYSSYLMKSIIPKSEELPIVPQMIFIFNAIAIISSITFIILLTHFIIIKRGKEKRSIQP